ncbi:TPA: hypothetical protein H1012_02470 [archaeon]|nr:hypothetical protein [Candidatus Naiadarchaeales archaeon SRR2090159.bin1288]
MSIIDETEQFFEEIDFLPIGEKLNKIRAKIGELKNLAKESAEKKQINEAIVELRKKEELEIHKLNEMRAIFKKFHAKINDEKLKAISCPAGLKIAKFGNAHGMENSYFFVFTSERMEEWYKKKLVTDMRPFKIDISGKTEDNLLALHAFGWSAFIENSGRHKWWVEFVQPLVFFKAASLHAKTGKGQGQPLKKSHLLMVFFMLKLAKQSGIKRVDFLLPDERRVRKIGQTEREIYKEIGDAAFRKGHDGNIAVFREE